MSNMCDADVASAFGVPVEITPYVPELLSDLWSLGIPPGVIVELLRPLNLPPQSTRVLDLGCGKGAVSITLAREFGFTVEGVDFFPPFVKEARKRAEDMMLNRTCRFSEGDIRDRVNKGGNYDIATLIWVGDALGDPGDSVGNLRRVVRSGGYMVYAEGYLKNETGPVGTGADATHGGRLSRPEILRELTAHGDIVLAEIIIPADQTRTLYSDYIDALNKGARRIIRDHPEHGETLKEHINIQTQMCQTLERNVVPAVWLLQKGSL